MTGPSPTSLELSDICDILLSVRFLNEALRMAVMGDGVASTARDALQAVCSEIDDKLLIVRDRMEEMLEGSEL